MAAVPIFKASPSGSGWTETVLYSFQDKKDGEYPFAGLAVDASGNLYGTTSSSGPCPPACGNVFEFSASGVFTVIHKFGGGLDGGIPMSGPTLDSSGRIYGTDNSERIRRITAQSIGCQTLRENGNSLLCTDSRGVVTGALLAGRP